MTFPRKKHKQRLTGYVLQVFDLIEQEHANGIPMTEIHRVLCEEAGFEVPYSSFANARTQAKKKRMAQPTTAKTTTSSPPTAAEAHKQTTATRGFEWSRGKDDLTADDIYKKKG